MSATNFPKSIQIKRLLFLLLLFSITLTSVAQESASPQKKWKILNEIYLMFPNLNGTNTMGSLPETEVDLSPSDVFSHFHFGAMIYMEIAGDKWAFTSDIAYMNLQEDVKPGTFINSGDITVKQFSWEVAGLRKLSPVFDAGIGARLNNLNNKLDLLTNNIIGGGTTPRSKQVTRTWVDPVIIARVKGAAGKKFIYQFRGDLGGFGIGSDFAWQLQAYGGWQFTKKFQFTAGYRFISFDYEKGSGENYFKYDMDTFGPVIRFGLNL